MARAEEPGCLTFRADHAVIDPGDANLRLQGNVRARCGRYELRGDRIELDAEPGRLCVKGPARLTLCPCDRAGISLGFESAELEEGDIKVDDPSLQIGDTTVLWLPWFWLRSPDRVGALPPKLAWRGDGGLLVGPGVHLPWSESDGSAAWMDLYVSGYTDGGFELEPSIVTPSSRTTVRFDRMDGDLLRIRSVGVAAPLEQGGLAWEADVSRGARARSGLVHLREAAQVYDHASAFIDLRPWRSAYLRSGLMVGGRRGGDHVALGPGLLANLGGALGAGAAWEAGAQLRLLDEDVGASQWTSGQARLLLGNGWGPVRFSLDAQSTVSASSTGDRSASDVAGWTTLSGGLPLVRRFGATEHTIEPVVRAMLFGASGTGETIFALRPGALGHGGRWLASGGLVTSLGPGGDRGARLALEAGRLGDLDDTSSVPMAAMRTGILLDLLRVDADAAALYDDEAWGAVATARAEAGSLRSVGATAEVQTRSGVSTFDARALHPAGAVWASVDAVSVDGTSLLAEGHVPLGAGVQWGAGSDWDVGAERWLAWGSGLTFEHPCGCARGRVWISRRVGRPGTDGWVTLELQ